MTQLTITHTHAEGTMIDGTARGDGTAEILKARGWRWSRNLGAWYVPQTRLVSSPARAARVARLTVADLTAAGFTVTLDADYTVPDDSLDARIDRQKERIAALEGKLDRKQSAEDAAWAKDKAAGDALPWGGEPIKIGHHSEGRHRRAVEKANAAMRRAVEASRETERAGESLDAAQRHLAALEAQRDYRPQEVEPGTVTAGTDWSPHDHDPDFEGCTRCGALPGETPTCEPPAPFRAPGGSS